MKRVEQNMKELMKHWKNKHMAVVVGIDRRNLLCHGKSSREPIKSVR